MSELATTIGSLRPVPDMLREQFSELPEDILEIAWAQFDHEDIKGHPTSIHERLRKLSGSHEQDLSRQRQEKVQSIARSMGTIAAQRVAAILSRENTTDV